MTLLYVPHDTTYGEDPFTAVGYNLSEQDQEALMSCRSEKEFLAHLATLERDTISGNASVIAECWTECIELIKEYYGPFEPAKTRAQRVKFMKI